jgi:hypothetical protein
MSLAVAANIAAVVGAASGASSAGINIHNALQPFRPNYKLQKWVIRVEQISAKLASNGDMITREELERFLKVLEV